LPDPQGDPDEEEDEELDEDPAVYTRCQFHQHYTRNFLYKSVLCSLQFCFVIFWQKNIGVTATCKMLMKLSTGANFTNFLQAAYCTKVFCTAFLNLQFFGKIILAQKLLVKCW